MLIVRMRVLSEKRMDLSQRVASLIGWIRTEEGRGSRAFCQSMEFKKGGRLP